LRRVGIPYWIFRGSTYRGREEYYLHLQVKKGGKRKAKQEKKKKKEKTSFRNLQCSSVGQTEIRRE